MDHLASILMSPDWQKLEHNKQIPNPSQLYVVVLGKTVGYYPPRSIKKILTKQATKISTYKIWKPHSSQERNKNRLKWFVDKETHCEMRMPYNWDNEVTHPIKRTSTHQFTIWRSIWLLMASSTQNPHSLSVQLLLFTIKLRIYVFRTNYPKPSSMSIRFSETPWSHGERAKLRSIHKVEALRRKRRQCSTYQTQTWP